jgi:allophanate hydrolase subunit 1
MIQPNVTALEDRQILNEMLESKAYYTRLIDSKTEQVFLLTANQPSLRTEIQEEMKQLDQEFLELQNDLYDLTDSEEVLAAMIQNYRLKLQILEETMLQLKAQSKEKNQDHETNRISI